MEFLCRSWAWGSQPLQSWDITREVTLTEVTGAANQPGRKKLDKLIGHPLKIPEFAPSYRGRALQQVSANFLIKGQRINSCGLWTIWPLLQYLINSATVAPKQLETKCISKWVPLCSNTTLSAKTEGGLTGCTLLTPALEQRPWPRTKCEINTEPSKNKIKSDLMRSRCSSSK